jgi:chemotaxis protein MotB
MKQCMKYYVSVCLLGMLLVVGCSSADTDRAARRNQVQFERISELESLIDLYKRQSEKAQQELATNGSLNALHDQKIAAMAEALKTKQATIDELSALVGQSALPIDLSSALAKWAQEAGSDLVSFDDKSGMVRFKSDLSFNKGESTVTTNAALNLRAFSQIMTMDSAKAFDILVVGHTDNMPIQRATTKQKHPTNWHLSVHRAIAVKDELEKSKVGPSRLAVKGYGEYRPLTSNKANQKGNAVNRRVEIFIVPAGQEKTK